MSADKLIGKELLITASPQQVWRYLTTADLVNRWMSETEVVSEWTPGSQILFKGRRGDVEFSNKGRILKFEPERILCYSYWSSIWCVDDHPDKYSYLEFLINKSGPASTLLKFSASNFCKEDVFGNMSGFWHETLGTFKTAVEHGSGGEQ